MKAPPQTEAHAVAFQRGELDVHGEVVEARDRDRVFVVVPAHARNHVVLPGSDVDRDDSVTD